MLVYQYHGAWGATVCGFCSSGGSEALLLLRTLVLLKIFFSLPFPPCALFFHDHYSYGERFVIIPEAPRYFEKISLLLDRIGEGWGYRPRLDMRDKSS